MVAFIANRAATTSTGAGSQLVTFAAGASISVGNTLLLYAAMDNSNVGGTPTNITAILDGSGNYWTRVATSGATGTVDALASANLWIAQVRFPYSNGSVINVVLDSTASRAAYRVNEFSGVQQVSAPVSSGGLIPTNASQGSGTTVGSLAATPTRTGQLVVAMAAVETNGTVTGDADTTDGSWSTIGNTVNNSGTDATSMTVSEQYKIVTGTTAQNWAATKASTENWAAITAVLNGNDIAPTGKFATTIDNFNRSVASGSWGATSETNQTWNLTGTAADFSVTSNRGTVALPLPNSVHGALIAAPSADLDFRLDISPGAVATGASIFAGVLARASGINTDNYNARLEFTTAGTIIIGLFRRVGGTQTSLIQKTTAITYGGANAYTLRFQVIGTSLKAKVWPVGQPEPYGWDVEATDANITAVGSYGIRTFTDAANTNVGLSTGFDNLLLFYVWAIGGNPNYPCIAGYEGLPTENLVVPLDTGTGYRFFEQITPSQFSPTDSLAMFASLETPRNGLSQHTLAFEYYSSVNNANVTSDDVLTVFAVPVGATSSGTWSSPATSALDAITKVGLGYLRLDVGESISFVIDGNDLATRYPGYRVARMGLRYIAWREDTPYGENPAPSIGMQVSWNDGRGIPFGRSTQFSPGTYLINNYRSTSTYEYRSLGETNFIPPNPAGVYSPYDVRPWIVNDFQAMNLLGTGSFITIDCVQGSDTSQDVIYFDYIEVVLDLVPERRSAVASTLVTNIPYIVDGYSNPAAGYFAPGFSSNLGAVFQPTNGAGAFVFDNSSSATFVVREAIPADGSDFFRALVIDPDDPGNVQGKYSLSEAVGVPLRLQALSQVRDNMSPYPQVDQATLADPALPRAYDRVTEYFPSVGVAPLNNIQNNGYFWPQFQTLGIPSEIWVRAGTDQIQYVTASGFQAFSYLKILVKNDAGGSSIDPLTVSIEQPLGNVLATRAISWATINSAEDVGNGWKELTVALTSPITPLQGQVALRMTTSSSRGYYVQGSYPKTIHSGYNNAAPNDDTRPTDTSIVLMCAINAPSVNLDSVTVNMAPLFTNFAGCSSATYQAPRLVISNKDDYGALTIERSADGGNSWKLAFLVDDMGGWSGTFVDREVPWDIQILYPISYRVRGYRDADRNFSETITSNWSGTSTSPGQVIGLSSNDSPAAGVVGAGMEFWFTPVTEGSLDIQWTPLSPVNFVQLHGKDYSYAMREAEDRGFELRVPILVNQTNFCTTAGSAYIANVTPYGEALGKGARSFSPRMYEAFVLPIIRSSARWTLKLPGGHTRTVSVQAGDFSTTTSVGLYLTELVITDVVEPDPDPYCEGLGS